MCNCDLARPKCECEHVVKNNVSNSAYGSSSGKRTTDTPTAEESEAELPVCHHLSRRRYCTLRSVSAATSYSLQFRPRGGRVPAGVGLLRLARVWVCARARAARRRRTTVHQVPRMPMSNCFPIIAADSFAHGAKPHLHCSHLTGVLSVSADKFQAQCSDKSE